jgi:hypothetical protein
VGIPLYARKDAREPPAGPDPIITQSVVKSGGLESLTSVWPAPVTTSRAWETMMKSGLIDGKSDLCNYYYSFLQVDVRPHRLCLPHIRPMRYQNADRQILDDRLHSEGLGQSQVVSSQIRLALSTQSPASRDLQGVRREQSRNKESEIIEAEWTASRDTGLRMPIPLFATDTPDPKILRWHARFCLCFRSVSVPTVVATAIMRLSPARCHGRGGHRLAVIIRRVGR